MARNQVDLHFESLYLCLGINEDTEVNLKK